MAFFFRARLVASLFLAFLLRPEICAAEKKEGFLLPPLEGEISLSSSYCEARRHHFHGGLDFRTGGKTGLPVRSVAAGSLARLRVQKRGFGHVLYIRHPSLNRMSVYAHLQEFKGSDNQLAKIARAALKGRKWGLDLPFAAGEVPIKEGELIALSGESGVGYPHLHFELREGDRPVNPAPYFQFFKEDPRPPDFLHLYLWPRTPWSLANDAPGAIRLSVQKEGPGEYRLQAPLVLSGLFEIGVGLVDHFGSGSNRLGVQSIHLVVGEKERFALAFDRFGFDETAHSHLLYHPIHSAWPGLGYVHVMNRSPGNPLSLVRKLKEDCGLVSAETLGVGETPFEIVAVDFSGNQSFLRGILSLQASKPAPEALAPFAPPTGGKRHPLELSCELFPHFLELRCQGAGASSAFRLLSGSKSLPFRLAREGKNQCILVLAPEDILTGKEDLVVSATDGRGTFFEGRVQSGVRRLAGSKVQTLTARDQRFVVRIPEHGIYSSGHAAVQVRAVNGRTSKKLLPVSPLYELEPFGYPLRREAVIAYEMDSAEKNPDSLGFYRYHPGRGGWYYLGGEARGGRLETGILFFEKVAVLRDLCPPILRWRAFTYSARDGRLSGSLEATEVGEGVDDEACEVRLDSAPIEFDYDPDRDLLRFEASLGKGARRHLTVRVKDRAGNWSKKMVRSF